MAETEEVPLCDAVGRILGTEVLAGIDVPHANSAMDGYAVRAASSAKSGFSLSVSESQRARLAMLSTGCGENFYGCPFAARC